jgi:RHH-type proline utilization regulon transcriptional repressor/proline dehydrogenase/delta 1-pyrroline-5-carboxylate dehydrogenase
MNWAEFWSRDAFKVGLDNVRHSLGRLYRLYIDGRWVETDERLESYNPAKDNEIIGHICQAGKAEVEEALRASQKAFPKWRATTPEKRAEYLFQAADLARNRRIELAALQVFEVGKTWTEADADVTEAIDFLNYYGQQMTGLGKTRRLDSPPGEVNRYFYQPRGLAAVISPWNFPLAISLGMISAALVTGNCVLYKPSGLSPAVGAAVAELFHEAALPAGVLAYLPGAGTSVGRMLVEDPKINVIAFTGSREVGLEIIRNAALIAAGQEHIKKVIAELGGKNAIIVDADADLDEAVVGILKSAFGYQGQKCSACSRVIVLEQNYDRFMARLVPAAEALVIGGPADPATDVGPVIDQKAKEKVLSYCELGKRDGRLQLLREGPETGSFAPLVIFDEIDPDSPLAQEEIFGPVLSVIKVKNIKEAVTVANGVSYALTGGLYSRSPANIQRVMEEFRVGNLYINRGITGAMVARQPFGGFKMSGIGAKAGGPDYLKNFVEPRCTTENTLRRGFSPEV